MTDGQRIWLPALLMLLLADAAIRPAACHQQDIRQPTHHDVQQSVIRFEHPSARFFSTLLFDEPRGQLVVAARDYLFRLSLDSLSQLEEAAWPAPEDVSLLCQNKGQSEDDCRNYIRVLWPLGDRIFACGTNAFSPRCSWRQIESINHVTDWISGIAKCPYSPRSNVTSLMTPTGDYFIASPTDFSGQDAAIYRLNVATNGNGRLRTMQYNSKWLNLPEFVGSFESDRFVYFFFREVAVEYINCGKVVYSRVARVCKSDAGGQLILKDTWTTFAKARLNCSLPGEFPFYYNEIQSVAYVADERLFYATFTTPDNGIVGSAVCSFTMDSIQEAFAGPFKGQSSPSSTWESYHSSHAHSNCQTGSSLHTSSLLEAEKFQLMDRAVPAARRTPLIRMELERFTHVVVDVAATKLHSTVHVIYVANVEGTIRKYTVLPRTQEACLVEIIEPFRHGIVDRQIRSMQFLKQTNSLYIGASDEVLRVPAQRCRRFRTRTQCLNAMDPYCGWHSMQEECTPPPNKNPLVSYWQQSITSCPVLNAPVDGGWSDWSDWTWCAHVGDGAQGDRCFCRQRRCDQPTPQHGGQNCLGHSHEVTNCTRHGQWTEWSAWSACSQTCGLAVKTRRRSCGNPEPAFGGRLCVGPDRDEIFCSTNPPCPVNPVAAVDGQWSDWGPWNECTASCGGGIRSRKRQCDSPAPQNGGAECSGCGVEYETCNSTPCPETKRITTWTPWLMVNDTDTGRIERRFRFSCKAPVDMNLLRTGPMKQEERICHADGNCLLTDSGRAEGGWTEWTEWSECSRQCGGGRQQRRRVCEGRPSDCDGPSLSERSCNMQPCRGVWSCWSDWTPCSASCGQGTRTRSRNCSVEGDDANANHLHVDGCSGPSEMKEFCNNPSCEPTEGWDSWTSWSLCDADRLQYRARNCLTNNPGPGLCQGRSREERLCIPSMLNAEDNTLAVTSLQSAGTASASSFGAVIGAAIGGCLAGVVLAVGGAVYWHRRQRPKIPSSPHYIPAKQQNHYVSMGSLDWRKGGDISDETNALTLKSVPHSAKSTANGSVDYPTATIKRNSHLNGREMRTNIEADHMF